MIKTARAQSASAAAPAVSIQKSARGRCRCGGTPDSTGECAQCRARRLAASRRAFLTQDASPQRSGEVTLLAQTAPTPAPAPGVFPPSPPPPPMPAAASCTYKITYTNMKSVPCPSGQCGAQIQYDITKVTASGSGCPPKLEGLRLTEKCTNDHGCVSDDVETGDGCDIGPGGTVSNCTDIYGLCGPASAFPASGCTEVVTQKLFVGGDLAETHTITFKIIKSGGSCSGTVKRS
jgi:hypothetical protein